MGERVGEKTFWKKTKEVTSTVCGFLVGAIATCFETILHILVFFISFAANAANPDGKSVDLD